MASIPKMQRDYAALKFCPVCAKPLENSPTSGLKACFVHGDFDCENRRIVWDTGQYERRNEPRITPDYPPTGTRRR